MHVMLRSRVQNVRWLPEECCSMPLTVFFLLALIAFIVTIVSHFDGRIRLSIAVLLLCIIELLRAIPLGR